MAFRPPCFAPFQLSPSFFVTTRGEKAGGGKTSVRTRRLRHRFQTEPPSAPAKNANDPRGNDGSGKRLNPLLNS